MAHYSGKNGGVYTGSLLIEDCEDAWNEYTNAHVTPSADSSVYKVGSASAKFVVVSAGASELLATEVISKNLTSYDLLYAWARCSVSTAAGDLQLLLDDTAECASPLESLNVPALTANTWKRIGMKLSSPSLLGSLISVGVKQVTNLADMSLWIDDVEAIALVDGIKSWTLDYTADTLEVTDFASSGYKEYVVGNSGWSGTFEGYKDGVPLGIGSQVILVLSETATPGQNWLGDVFITGVHPNVSIDGPVTYSYDFQGTGALECASV